MQAAKIYRWGIRSSALPGRLQFPRHRSGFCSASDAPGYAHFSPQGSYHVHNKSVCKGVIVGRTGSPPRLLSYDSNRTSLAFSVATNELRISDGEVVEERTQWNRVIVNDTVPGYDTFLKTLATGSLVYVEGNLRISKRSHPSGNYSQYVSILVSRNNGVFRLLQGAADVPSTPQPDRDGIADDSDPERVPF